MRQASSQFPAGEVMSLALPRQFIGQLLSGLDVLIEQWEYTAEFLEHGQTREDMIIRECSDPEEAHWIAEYYRAIHQTILRQFRDQTSQ